VAMVIERLVVGALQVDCYVLVDEATGSAAVIDPGDECETISRVIRESQAHLATILLTHGHYDHTFAVGELLAEFPGASVAMHRADVEQLGQDPLELLSTFYDLSHYQSFQPTEYLEDGQEVMVGDTSLRVIHTPGHTPGGVCCIAGSVLFTGDTLFAGSIGRTDLPGGSYDELMSSIQELMLLPDDFVVYPGHGEGTTIGEERTGNPWL
jgi:hydroxyacylglutathione hydrolase